MNEASQRFLGSRHDALPQPKQFDPFSIGKTLPNNLTDCVVQTRSMTLTPELAGVILMSNVWYQDTDQTANRAINDARACGELKLLENLMIEGEFAPHRSTLGITEDGRLIEGQGRLLAQFKTQKTFTYTVDIVKDDQRSVSRYLGATRGTTATTSLPQLWQIIFGLSLKQAVIAQQMFNGKIWHDEDILGTNLRSSTKAAICQLTKLDKDIREISGIYAKAKVPKGISAPALATIELLALRWEHNPDRVAEFRTGILTGVMLKARDARYVVRNYLMNRELGKPIRYQTQVGYLKSAFDKFIIGSDMNRISAPGRVSFKNEENKRAIRKGAATGK